MYLSSTRAKRQIVAPPLLPALGRSPVSRFVSLPARFPASRLPAWLPSRSERPVSVQRRAFWCRKRARWRQEGGWAVKKQAWGRKTWTRKATRLKRRFEKRNDGWTRSIPVRPLRAERRSLFSSSHPLEIQFLIRVPALMNICSSGTPTARMLEFVFALKVFLSACLAGDGEAAGGGGGTSRVKEPIYIFSRTRRLAGAARDIRPHFVASACLVNYVRLFSQPGLWAPSNQRTICSRAPVVPADKRDELGCLLRALYHPTWWCLPAVSVGPVNLLVKSPLEGQNTKGEDQPPAIDFVTCSLVVSSLLIGGRVSISHAAPLLCPAVSNGTSANSDTGFLCQLYNMRWRPVKKKKSHFSSVLADLFTICCC